MIYRHNFGKKGLRFTLNYFGSLKKSVLEAAVTLGVIIRSPILMLVKTSNQADNQNS